MSTTVYVEDHVVPQLFTSAIEAYEFEHKAHIRGKPGKQLETFGLLWGYVMPAFEGAPTRIVPVMATVETSALRHQEWVAPNFDSLRMKREFFAKYWPNLTLVGTFHSHPYKSLDELKRSKGWNCSTWKTNPEDGGDEAFWPAFHRYVCPETPHLAHLVVAITELKIEGWAWPKRTSSRGYEVTAGKRKMWISTYASHKETYESDYGDIENGYTFDDTATLSIPSLENRFNQYTE